MYVDRTVWVLLAVYSAAAAAASAPTYWLGRSPM